MKINNEQYYNLFQVRSKNGVLRCLKAGVDINLLNSEGQTALFTCNDPDAMQAMIDSGINIHHLDNEGNNALFFARNIESVELLISNGININHRNKADALALQYIDVSPGLIRYMVKSGLNVHSRDKAGNSLLFVPFEGYVYDALVAEGCDINYRNNKGQTAFDHWQSTSHYINGKYTHRELTIDNYIRFLIRNIHLTDQSVIIFNQVTMKSVELMHVLTQKGLLFKLNEKCVISEISRNVKEIITNMKALTDLSHVTFYTEYDLPLIRYAGKPIIKWLIRNNIAVDIESLKERDLYEDILVYSMKREEKAVRVHLRPSSNKLIRKRRI